MDVSTDTLAETGFLDIAKRSKISAERWEDARQGLANIQKPWLLVLDNADDPKVDYERYFPSGTSGVVVLTSRNIECRQHSTEHLALNNLSEAAAQELLLTAAHIPDDQHHKIQKDAMTVANLLQSHPLAIIQAGAYVSRGHCTLAEYPQVYRRQRQRLSTFRPKQAQSRYGDVYATFEASASVLQSSAHTLQSADAETARDALHVLPLLAAYGPSRLPLSLFEAGWRGAQWVSPVNDDVTDIDRLTVGHVSRLPSFIQVGDDTWDSFRLVEAVQLLKAFSLVTTDHINGCLHVSTHPLIHAWARDRQSEASQHESWLIAGCLVAISSLDDDLWRREARQLQPHLQAVTGWEMAVMFAQEPVTMITCVVMKCGWLMNGMRDDVVLFLLMQRLCAHLGLKQSMVDPEWLPVYELIARNFYNHGKVKLAVTVLEEVIRIQEQTLAKEHPGRLASQHGLAGAYQANGQVEKAMTVLEEVVGIQEQTLAKEHPVRLASQHALAGAYEANGQVEKAVTVLEEVVRIQEQTLAKEHPSRLASQHELAGAYRANGQVEKALTVLEEVVRIREQTLAKEHPSRLASQHALAVAYEANGQMEKAVTVLEEVVRIREQTLAKEHPDRLASQHELARAYQANGQVEKAVTVLEEVVQIREQTLAKEHPSRLASQHNLAIYYWLLGSRHDAFDMMKQVVDVHRQVLDEHHPDRQVSESSLDFLEAELQKLEA